MKLNGVFLIFLGILKHWPFWFFGGKFEKPPDEDPGKAKGPF